MSKENTVQETTKPMEYDALLGSVGFINSVKQQKGDVLVILEIGRKFYSINNDAVKLNECTQEEIVDFKGVKICGFESWKLDEYLPKLIRCGNKVAMCNAA